MNGVNRRHLEIVVLRLDDVTAETPRLLAGRLTAGGHVRVVSAVEARREIDGTVSVEDWTEAGDVFDLVADLTVRRQGRWRTPGAASSPTSEAPPPERTGDGGAGRVTRRRRP